MLVKEIKYSYNDVSLVPSQISEIEHRTECNPFTEMGYLPIFAAPMSSVVSDINFSIFEKNKITPILPRNIDIEIRLKYLYEGKWVAFSLTEFEKEFCAEIEKKESSNIRRALIDVANGHMRKTFELVSKAKEKWGDKLKVMIGNIANPDTYYDVWKCGADYVRVGIGGGSCCITSSNTAINYPQASLIDEVYKSKVYISESFNKDIDSLPKIIADGGIRNYSDVIKAIALGADYVMIGGLLGSTIESSGKLFYYDEENNKVIISEEDSLNIKEQNDEFIFNESKLNKLFKEVYGMASKKGQIDISGGKKKTSEGIIKIIPVTTNLCKWSDNMASYLRSAMSYVNAKTLNDVKKSKVIIMSNNAKNAINK